MKTSKERKKRAHRYTTALSLSCTIEPNQYYKSDNNKRLREVKPEHVKLNGVNYESTLKVLSDLREQHIDLNNDVQGALQDLTAILIEKGYNTPNIELNALIQDILELNIIDPKKEYEGFKLVNGYVVGLGYDLIQEVKEKPEDFDKGYWQLVDGEWKLDNIKYQQIWGG